MKKILLLLVAMATLFSVAFANQCKDNPLYSKWLVYYSALSSPGDFDTYNPIVFDAYSHPDLEPLQNVKTVLGHISIGDVNSTRSYFSSVQQGGLLLAPIAEKPGSWYVDIRKPYWTSLMIQVVIPSILSQGFTGLLLDNLDAPLYLETANPAAYMHMTQAAVNLVIAIRTAFPHIPLMMKGAYKILDRVGGHLNYALGSAVLTQYNRVTQRYDYVPIKQYQSAVAYLQNAQTLYPNLKLMSVDYWNPADTYTVSKIYKSERQNGFTPYVSSVDLQHITPEP